ncbi:hypothetical protein ACSBR1_028287 [Camellia fascicularis]
MLFWCNQKKTQKGKRKQKPPTPRPTALPAALTVVTGAISTRILFLTALETTKTATFRLVEPFKLSEPTQAAIANGVACMAVDVACQPCSYLRFIFYLSYNVKVIICWVRCVNKENETQKGYMVEGYSGHVAYNGGLDVARKVLKVDGIRGLYRGFGLSVLTYSPSSAVWWASYVSSQRLIWRQYLSGLGIFATGGIFAGATASCITMPLDTMKTRLQVMGHEKKHTVKEVVKGLVADDAWKGLYKGPGPRFFTMSAWGTSMILSYEYLRRDSSFTLLLYSIIFVVVIIMQNDEIAKTFMDLIIVNYCIGKSKPMSYPLFSYNHAQSI